MKTDSEDMTFFKEFSPELDPFNSANNNDKIVLRRSNYNNSFYDSFFTLALICMFNFFGSTSIFSPSSDSAESFVGMSVGKRLFSFDLSLGETTGSTLADQDLSGTIDAISTTADLNKPATVISFVRS